MSLLADYMRRMIIENTQELWTKIVSDNYTAIFLP